MPSSQEFKTHFLIFCLSISLIGFLSLKSLITLFDSIAIMTIRNYIILSAGALFFFEFLNLQRIMRGGEENKQFRVEVVTGLLFYLFVMLLTRIGSIALLY